MLTSSLNLGCASGLKKKRKSLYLKTSMLRSNIFDMAIHFSWFVFRGFYGVLNRIPDAKLFQNAIFASLEEAEMKVKT